MCNLIGKEVGVAKSMRAVTGSGWYDLTAGDGVAADGLPWERNCSPGILAYHARNVGKPVDVSLYEIKTGTYDRLVASLVEHLPALDYSRVDDATWRWTDLVCIRAFHGSGSDADLSLIQRGTSVFALNDPNAITDFAMRPTFAVEVAERTPWFRSLSTLGCNPAGLKRLSADERRNWFRLLQQQERALPQHRDLLLAAIERDDAQWAYLMGEPMKWKSVMEAAARSSFQRFKLTITAAWWRTQQPAYDELKRQLFLTRGERGD